MPTPEDERDAAIALVEANLLQVVPDVDPSLLMGRANLLLEFRIPIFDRWSPVLRASARSHVAGITIDGRANPLYAGYLSGFGIDVT